MSMTDIRMLPGPGEGCVGPLLAPGGSGLIGLKIVSTDTLSRVQGLSFPGL